MHSLHLGRRERIYPFRRKLCTGVFVTRGILGVKRTASGEPEAVLFIRLKTMIAGLQERITSGAFVGAIGILRAARALTRTVNIVGMSRVVTCLNDVNVGDVNDLQFSRLMLFFHKYYPPLCCDFGDKSSLK